jgi:hypothetical protein
MILLITGAFMTTFMLHLSSHLKTENSVLILKTITDIPRNHTENLVFLTAHFKSLKAGRGKSSSLLTSKAFVFFTQRCHSLNNSLAIK